MNGHDVGGGAAQHFLGVLADLQYLAAELVHRDNGGLPGHNALALLKKQGRRGAQVDGYISLKQIHAFSPYCLEAAAPAYTAAHPAFRSSDAHAESVEPVVTISSMTSTRLSRALSGAQQT